MNILELSLKDEHEANLMVKVNYVVKCKIMDEINVVKEEVFWILKVDKLVGSETVSQAAKQNKL